MAAAAETAHEHGLEFYMLLSNMKTQTSLGAMASLYHQWDKDFRDFMERELSHAYDRDRNECWRLLMVHLFFLVILLFSSPVSAQWLIEESQQTDLLASRPTATAASLVSDDGRLAWEYMCVRTASGRYFESLDLYTERSGEQFRGGTIRYRFDDGKWQRARWNSGGSWLGFHSDEEMRQCLTSAPLGQIEVIA